MFHAPQCSIHFHWDFCQFYLKYFDEQNRLLEYRIFHEILEASYNILEFRSLETFIFLLFYFEVNVCTCSHMYSSWRIRFFFCFEKLNFCEWGTLSLPWSLDKSKQTEWRVWGKNCSRKKSSLLLSVIEPMGNETEILKTPSLAFGEGERCIVLPVGCSQAA